MPLPDIRPIRPRPKLAQWLFDRCYSDGDAAELFNCSRQAVDYWTRPFDEPSRRTPQGPSLTRIVEVTRGEVTAADFYPPHLNGEGPAHEALSFQKVA